MSYRLTKMNADFGVSVRIATERDFNTHTVECGREAWGIGGDRSSGIGLLRRRERGGAWRYEERQGREERKRECADAVEHIYLPRQAPIE
jgi:hypothetical protein